MVLRRLARREAAGEPIRDFRSLLTRHLRWTMRRERLLQRGWRRRGKAGKWTKREISASDLATDEWVEFLCAEARG